MAHGEVGRFIGDERTAEIARCRLVLLLLGADFVDVLAKEFARVRMLREDVVRRDGTDAKIIAVHRFQLVTTFCCPPLIDSFFSSPNARRARTDAPGVRRPTNGSAPRRCSHVKGRFDSAPAGTAVIRRSGGISALRQRSGETEAGSVGDSSAERGVAPWPGSAAATQWTALRADAAVVNRNRRTSGHPAAN